MNQEQNLSYEIVPRPVELGSGWTLVLLANGQEATCTIFPLITEPPEVGAVWWIAMKDEQRRYWQMMAASAVPQDARRAYLLAEAYTDAREAVLDWVSSRARPTLPD